MSKRQPDKALGTLGLTINFYIQHQKKIKLHGIKKNGQAEHYKN